MLQPGTTLGPYRISRLLGAGGMGEVYSATDLRLDREVAVKVLPEHLASNSIALERFRREAKAVAALSHPNIVALFDVGSDRGLHYAVTELLEGETLRTRFGRGPIPSRDALQITLEIAEGVAAAHAHDIIHRDLKPENVFLTSDGRVKVLDFGLARDIATQELDTATDFLPTRPGMIMGTIGYLAPEQADLRPLSKATDVFSLGCLLFEAITGRVPFHGETSALALAALIRDQPPHLPHSDRLTAATDSIVQKCLSKDPKDRFPDGSALVAEIRSLLTDDEAVERLSTHARRAVRRRSWGPPIAIASLVALAIPIALYVQHERAVIDQGYALRLSDVQGDEETRRLVSLALHADAEGNRANATQLMEQAHRRAQRTAFPEAFLSSWNDARGSAQQSELWTAEALKRLRPDTPAYESLLVRYLAAHQDEEHAKQLALAQSILDLRPDAWRFRLAAAHMLLTQRDNDAALAQLKKIDINQPDDRRLVLVLADRASLGDIEGATRDLHASRVRLQPAFYNYTLGRIAWTRGDIDEAIAAFEQAAHFSAIESLTGLEIDSLLYQAMAYIKRGDLSGAQRSLAACAARARQIDQVQREFDCAAISAYLAHRSGDAAERDRRLAEAQSLVAHPGDLAALRVLAIRMRSNVWKSWKRPPVAGYAVLTGVDSLIDAREAWFNGDLAGARTQLRRARAEAIDSTGFLEEASLLAAELGEPSKSVKPDPPYPNILRWLAVFDGGVLKR